VAVVESINSVCAHVRLPFGPCRRVTFGGRPAELSTRPYLLRAQRGGQARISLAVPKVLTFVRSLSMAVKHRNCGNHHTMCGRLGASERGRH
jgi:hypothetical protein